MTGSGLYWFKFELSTFQDPKVERLMEERGLDAVTIWLAGLTVLYSAANVGQLPLPVDVLVLRVSKILGITKNRAKKALFSAASAGLFDRELWAEGKALSEGVAKRYIDYQRRCEQLATARASRARSDNRADNKPES